MLPVRKTIIKRPKGPQHLGSGRGLYRTRKHGSVRAGVRDADRAETKAGPQVGRPPCQGNLKGVRENGLHWDKSMYIIS